MEKPSSRFRWEMLPGHPSCECATTLSSLPNELGPGFPSSCNHLYIKKSLGKEVFQISMRPATSLGSPPLGGRDSEKPQGMRVQRGGPMTIVIHPTGGEATKEVPRPAPATCERGPTFASLADERAADDLGVLLIGGGGSRVNSPANAKRRPLSLRRSSRTSSADSRSRKSAAVHPVTLKMPSRAFEVDIKLDKSSKEATARSPNQLADRAYMFDCTGEKGNLIRCYKHTISSLISSRIGDMNRESRMLQESECKRKGAHRPRRAPPAARKTTAPGGSTRCLYDSISKQMMQKPRQFSFHQGSTWRKWTQGQQMDALLHCG